MEIDLVSLQSVTAFANAIKSMGKPIHILINNAAVMACPHQLTKDGFEMQMGTNHFGPFYLTRLLLPLLSESGTKESPSRVINLTSCGNILFPPPDGIDFEDIDGTKHYNPWVRYGETKLAAILFSRELNKRAPSNVIAIAVHPGTIRATNLGQYMDFANFMNCMYLIWKNGRLGLVNSEIDKTIPQGAATTVLAALDPEIQPNEYYADCNICKNIHPSAANPEQQIKLWDISESLVDQALLKLNQ